MTGWLVAMSPSSGATPRISRGACRTQAVAFLHPSSGVTKSFLPPPRPQRAQQQQRRRQRRNPRRGGAGGGGGAGMEHKCVVLCLNRQTGKILWEHVAKVATPHEGYHRRYGSFASNSPVTDGKHLYAFFGSRGLSQSHLNG